MENKLSDFQKVKVKQIIAATFLRGGSWLDAAKAIEAEIGLKLGMTQIYEYRKQEEQEWLANTKLDIAEYKAKQLAEIAYLRQETYREWDRSKKDAETITFETIGISEKDKEALKEFGGDKFDGDPRNPDKDLAEVAGKKLEVKTKETTKISGQCGNPRYIQMLIKLLEREAKLLGLDAPTKVEITDWRAEAIKAGATPEQLSEIEKFHEQLTNAVTDRFIN